MKKDVIATTLAVALSLGLIFYKYSVDEAAWQRAQDAIVRLRSGMQYESLLMVRTRLADADAAVEDYVSQWRVFPMNHQSLLQAAHTGISYSSEALDWSTRPASENSLDTDPADAQLLSRYLDVSTSLPRWCENGQLAFDPRVVAADFRVYGDYYLELSEGKNREKLHGSELPLNADRELKGCQQKQIDAVKAQNAALARKLLSMREQASVKRAKDDAEAAAEKAQEEAFLAKYPFEVELSSYYPCSLSLSIDGQAASRVILSSGIEKSFRIQRSADLEDAICDVYSSDRPPYRTPQTEIETRVNGSRYLLNWAKENKSDPKNYNQPFYRTTLAPPPK